MNKDIISGISPVISVTKLHKLSTGEMYYLLFVGGKFEGAYNKLEELMARIQQIIWEV